MKMCIETITPEIAGEYLRASQGNRRIKDAKVASYARDMASGAWQMNGEPIIFSKSGALANGHHRLFACIKAGEPFQSVVVYGVDDESIKTIDSGAPRSISDVLFFRGEANTNVLSALVLAAVSIAAGRPRSANLSSSEVLDFLDRFPEARDHANESVRKCLPRIGSVLTAISFISEMTGKIDEFEAFHSVLKDGVPFQKHCAAHALRERILRDVGGKKMSLADAHRLTVTAWNKFCEGRPVKFLRAADHYGIDGWTMDDAMPGWAAK